MSHYECEIQEEAEQAVIECQGREGGRRDEFRFAGQVPRLMRMQSTR